MQRSEATARKVRESHRYHFESCTAKYGGEIIQYYGDGTLSIFTSALASVQCACEMQGLWNQSQSLQVPVRIGIHLGEVEVGEGEVIGDSVNIASRVESAAISGSVLISNAVYQQIKNNTEIKTQHLGAYRFKNVEKALDLYALVGDGLALVTQIRPEAKLHEALTFANLPTYPTKFVGRKESTKRISELLVEPTCRLLTILGSGGLGKTRLAVEVAGRLKPQFDSGVCYVALESTTKHDEVPQVIASRLGLKEDLESSWMEVIRKFLLEKELLLILDNLEQIIEAGTYISSLLESCKDLTVLVTSREILDIPLEIEFALPTFETPAGSVTDLEELLTNESCALFVHKARLVNPLFEITKTDIEPFKDICIQLEGLPLALELAASRTKLFTINEIRQRLIDVFELLSRSRKGASKRHQTMHSTIQWSYDLLDDSEQEVFLKMAIFPGGFTIEALQAILQTPGVLDCIESFINKSLIRKTEGPDPRFGMLKVIRDFGMSLIKTRKERTTWLDQFARYYEGYAIGNEQALVGKDQLQWIRRYDAEYDNLKRALDHLKITAASKAADMGASIWRYYLLRGFITSGLSEIDQLISLSEIGRSTRAKLFHAAGILNDNIGDTVKAQEYFKEALEIYQQYSDKAQIVRTLNHLGWTEFRLGKYKETISYANDALKICDQTDDKSIRLRVLNNIAWTEMFQGLYEESRTRQETILNMAKEYGNPRMVSFAQTCLAWSLSQCVNGTNPADHINQAIRSFRQLGDQQMIAFSEMVHSDLMIDAKEYYVARQILEKECLPRFQAIGDRWGLAYSHDLLYQVTLEQDAGDLALSHLRESRRLRERIGDRWGLTKCRIEEAGFIQRNNTDSMFNLEIDLAIADAHDMSASLLLVRALHLKALLSIQEGRPAQSLMLLSMATVPAGRISGSLKQIWDKILSGEIDKISRELDKEEVDRAKEGSFSIQKILSNEH